MQAGTCELNEDNIVTFDKVGPATCHVSPLVTWQVTSSPGACQAKCRGQAECHWFTHFDTFCYLLDHCGTLTK